MLTANEELLIHLKAMKRGDKYMVNSIALLLANDSPKLENANFWLGYRLSPRALLISFLTTAIKPSKNKRHNYNNSVDLL